MNFFENIISELFSNNKELTDEYIKNKLENK